MSVESSPLVNGIDTEALHESIREISQDSSKGQTHWTVRTDWKGGTRSDTCLLYTSPSPRDS